MPTELKNQVSLLSLGWVGWVVYVEIKANQAHLELELGLSSVIVAYLSLFRWSHTLHSDQNTKNSCSAGHTHLAQTNFLRILNKI